MPSPCMARGAGRTPLSALLGAESGVGGLGGGGRTDSAEEAMKSVHYRPFSEPCKVGVCVCVRVCERV